MTPADPRSSANHDVALVVATRNRPQLLSVLLDRLKEQELRPTPVVVVDSSDLDVRDKVRDAVTRAAVPAVYVHSDVASLPRQRNLGIEWLEAHSPDTQLVQFLDDDVAPAPDYVRRLATLLRTDTVGAIAGVSGISLELEPPRRLIGRTYRRAFGLWSPREGVLLPGGHNIPVSRPADGADPDPIEVDWLFGCSMWRRDVVSRLRFCDGMPGGALFEDVEFSARASRLGQLVVDPGARLVHALASEGRVDTCHHHRRWVRNRYEVVRAMGPRGSRWWFWWSTLGYAAAIGRHAARGDADYRRALHGVIDGAADVVLRRPMT